MPIRTSHPLLDRPALRASKDRELVKGNLMVHTGSDRVTYEELAAMPAPEALGNRHVPIPHVEIVDAISNELRIQGFAVGRMEFAVNKTAQRLFGVLDFEPATAEAASLVTAPESRGLSVGFKHGNDQSFAMTLVAGGRVWVCDNLSLSGDQVVLRRKHTSGFNFGQELHEGFNEVIARYVDLDRFVDQLRNTKLSDERARVAIYDLLMERTALPLSYLPQIHGWYFHPESFFSEDRPLTPEAIADLEHGTAWGVYNAFTRALRETPLATRIEHTSHLTPAFTSYFGRN